jgi:hypothetical protein
MTAIGDPPLTPALDVIEVRDDQSFAYQERRMVTTIVDRTRTGNRLSVISDPADWIINDILIDGESQIAGSGPLPGQILAEEGIGMWIAFPPIERTLAIAVTYVGDREASRPFVARLSSVPQVGPG